MVPIMVVRMEEMPCFVDQGQLCGGGTGVYAEVERPLGIDQRGLGEVSPGVTLLEAGKVLFGVEEGFEPGKTGGIQLRLLAR